MDPQNTPEVIDKSKLRTGKEKFYLTIVILFSIIGWIWILYSVYKDAVNPPPRQEARANKECIVRDNNADTGGATVYKIDPSQLFEGERCLPREQLTEDEMRQLEQEGIPTVSEIDERISKITSIFSFPVLLLLFFFGQLFLHLIAVAFIRINAVKLGSEQFPELWTGFQEEAKRLGMKKTPDAFVMLGQGAVNAFAARLVFRRIIVFFAELAETLTEEGNKKQLNAVIGHELGHHALGHTHILNWFLIAEIVPFLGPALSRAREYSADRVMKALAIDQEVCERALVKLAAGKRFGQLANIEAFMVQRREEGGFFAWLAEKIATHPHLPNRIKALREFSS